MFIPTNNALSAIRAHARGMEVNARNIANAVTPDSKPLEAVFEESPSGGVVMRAEETASQAEVDLARETVGLIANRQAIEASLKLIRASEKTLGVLLDTIG